MTRKSTLTDRTKITQETRGLSQISHRELRAKIQKNLRQLCDTKPSVSFVCDEIGINRQQFAKYLDGRATPSFENALRIADYFGIAVEEFIEGLDPEYSQIEPDPVRVPLSDFAIRATETVERVKQTSSTLRFPHDGFYLSYNSSFRTKDEFSERLIVSLIKLRSECNVVYYQRRQFPLENFGKRWIPQTFDGVGYVIMDGLQINYVDNRELDALASIFLKQVNLGNPDLCGIQLVRAFTDTYEPAAARIYWSYQGEKPDIRHLIRQCGLFNHDDRHLDSRVVKWLQGGYDSDGKVLRGL